MFTTHEIKPTPRHNEFGDFFSCLENLYVLLHNLAVGEVVESAIRLRKLQEHILLYGDPKSVKWLLPAIEAAVGKNRANGTYLL